MKLFPQKNQNRTCKQEKIKEKKKSHDCFEYTVEIELVSNVEDSDNVKKHIL